MNRSTLIRTGGVALAGVAALALAVPAFANDGDVIRRGHCSVSTDWKLKASPEDGRIEVEGEVDSNVAGRKWNWKLLHNGEVSARGSATTTGRSGSFEVRRLMVDAAGKDRLGLKATDPKTNEVCRGSLTF